MCKPFYKFDIIIYNQKNPPILTSQNTTQLAPPSCHWTNVAIEEVNDEDTVSVTPTHSHHATFAEIPFSTPSGEDVLFKRQSTPLQLKYPECEYFYDVFQSSSSGSSTQSTLSPSQCSPSTPTPSHCKCGWQDHSPRAGTHSTRGSTHASGTTGNRMGYKANDVYTIFTKEDDRYVCNSPSKCHINAVFRLVGGNKLIIIISGSRRLLILTIMQQI